MAPILLESEYAAFEFKTFGYASTYGMTLVTVDKQHRYHYGFILKCPNIYIKL